MSGLEMKGLSEFEQGVASAMDKFPKEAEQSVNRLGNKLRKAYIEASPDGGRAHRKKLNKSWHKKVVGYTGAEVRAEVWSTAPHVGLVDRGHEIVTPGRRHTGKRTKALHFIDTMAEKIRQEDLSAECERFLTKITKRLEGEPC